MSRDLVSDYSVSAGGFFFVVLFVAALAYLLVGKS